MSGLESISHYRLSHPTGRLIGRIDVPGSKSESNRLLMLRDLYFPDLEIEGLSDSEDTQSMLRCLKDRGNFIHVQEAGTVMRFLTAYYAIKEGDENILMGTSRMHERPVGVLVEALRQLGAEIEYLEKDGYPPIKIYGRDLKGGEIALDAGVSSQFISALMMIAPALESGLRIKLKGLSVSAPYIYLTSSLMRRLGFKVEVTGDEVIVMPGIPKMQKHTFRVEPDWSAVSYWFQMARLSPFSEIYLPGFLQQSLQGDAKVNGFFEPLGVQTQFMGPGIRLKKENRLPDRIKVNLLQNPDLAQTLVVTYAALGIPAEIAGLQSLRIKETDRLTALQNELSKTGADIEIGDDFLKIHSGIKSVKGLEFETYNDHRMAMALAPLALLDEIVIKNPLVVAKSYPSFWSDLEKVGFQLNK